MSRKSKENHSLKRGLSSRHLSMIAIGGSIGTGLFLAMGGNDPGCRTGRRYGWHMPSWEPSYSV